ncbi:MAG TPA: polysaccharide biosynthesis C-terminal domain-containing protein, partial [Chitinophagaceae bacterium]|nr:polysaccharide biosynthesis C-terminal domain-containing protein [Chitinophagaceae bacterium]
GVMWVLMISVVSIFFFRFWFLHFENNMLIDQFTYCKYAIFFIAGMLLNNFYTAVFQSQQNFFLPNFLSGLMNIIFIIILFAEKINNYSLPVIRDSFFIFILIGGMIIAGTYFIWNKISDFDFMSMHELKILLQYSTVALLTNVIFFLVYRIDYWFVKYNCSASDLGNYIQASRMGQLIFVIPQIIAAAMFPQTASGKLQLDVSNAIVKLFRIFMQIFIMLTIFILLTGNWIFILIFGQSFNTMHLPFLILLPGILCLSTLSLLSAYFAGKGNLKLNLKGAVFALIVVVTGNILLLKFYSIEIAAMVSSVGYAVNFIYSVYHFIKLNKIKFIKLWQWEMSDWLWLKQILFNK